MNFKDFAAKDLKEFSIYANVRTIPSMVDGLKVPQRKALFGALHHGGQTTVARMANHAAEVTSYTHGEENMGDTLVIMGQDFPGSNNMPLIQRKGQYGTILDRKASAARYIKASVHRENFDLLFSKDDTPILQMLFQEEQYVEPVHYLPCLPLALINGADGIGVGYATSVFQHSVKDVRRAVKEVMEHGAVVTKLVPHFNGYKGTVKRLENDQIEIRGVITIIDRTTLRISEVPPKWDRKKYRDFLNGLTKKVFDANSCWVKSYANHSSDEAGWNITVKVPMAVTRLDEEDLLKAFNLIERNTQNVVFWDTVGQLKAYQNVEEVVEEFVAYRHEKYAERKQSMLDALEADRLTADLKIRFIRYWNEASSTLVSLNKAGMLDNVVNALACTLEQAEKLLEMNIYSLTKERLESLVKAKEKLYHSYQELQQTTPAQIWEEDLKKVK